MKTLKTCIAKIFTALILLPAMAAAAPNMVNYQGRLVDTAGNPLAGPVNITFKIYNAAGVQQWTETHNGVIPDNGIFNVSLGSFTALSPAVFGSDARYLGVTIGADPEMAPRTRLVSTPYAITAGSLGNNDSQAIISTDTVISGSQLRLGNFPGASMPVGMGTGALAYNSTTNRVNYWNGAVWGSLETGGASPWLSGSGLVYLGTLSDNVGVGTAAPLYKLDVAGGIFASSSMTALEYHGDGSALTGLVRLASNENVGGIKTFTSSFTVADAAGIAADRYWLSQNVEISSEASSDLGAGVHVSSNIYIVGFSSAAKYYGDGPALTNLSAANISGGILGAAVVASSVAVDAVYTNSILAGAVTKNKLAVEGCVDGQIIKLSGGAWACGTDTAGAGAMSTKNGGVEKVSATSAMDFDGNQFNITEGPVGQANIVVNSSSVTLLGPSIGSNEIEDSAVTDAKIAGMSSSKLSGPLPILDGSSLAGVITSTAVIVADIAAKADDTLAAHLAGAESITGNKTFNNVSLTMSGGNGDIISGSSITTTGNFYGNGSTLGGVITSTGAIMTQLAGKLSTTGDGSGLAGVITSTAVIVADINSKAGTGANTFTGKQTISSIDGLAVTFGIDAGTVTLTGGITASSATITGDAEVRGGLIVSSGTKVNNIIVGKISVDPASVGAGACLDTPVVLVAAAAGDKVVWTAPAGVTAGISWGSYDGGLGSLGLRICNATAAPIDPVLGDWGYFIVR